MPCHPLSTHMQSKLIRKHSHTNTHTCVRRSLILSYRRALSTSTHTHFIKDQPQAPHMRQQVSHLVRSLILSFKLPWRPSSPHTSFSTSTSTHTCASSPPMLSFSRALPPLTHTRFMCMCVKPCMDMLICWHICGFVGMSQQMGS
ncbi:hypothetical protein DUNSADRAFT_1765 [Dunaliella salina]|uniref:Encoded protein n=1 Tax=Dunaliella salina TaxID=3046 RepID=A0ABQ7FX18_DUNSA|nr:hypothetical protein DUNSADRAFT_1765 [Dunaliella salina]|eukprot:KAF5826905.1 hypothetical protein DUNSADRAFT_1765 [Dunaliella salina]